MSQSIPLGATYVGGGRSQFCVWAPLVERVEVHVLGPGERLVPLAREEDGYHRGIVEGIEPGTRYFYRLDGRQDRPDPASRFQPEGVHGPSQIVDQRGFTWEDQRWPGLPLRRLVIYELHVGTFTPEGTFAAIIPHLDDLREMGITAVELMPVSQFPGGRNWGYDGVHPFAVQNSYGGPEGLRRLANACHQRGLALVLDVVYNHLGPEGNYLAEFAPYFTDHYRTPWGWAVNFDGALCEEVRRYFIANATYWVAEFHVDALRLDAVHAIKDFSAQPFLADLAAAVHREGDRLARLVHVIAESDLNDTRFIRPPELGGYGLDAQWSDDFHHSLHALLTGEQSGYYLDFGDVRHLARALADGFTYSGQYSRYRRRRQGNSPRANPAPQFVVCAQNHDQIGNRRLGDRLSHLVSWESLKLAAGTVLLSPFLPLLFMGEEYGERAPFQYFTSHSDPDLVEAVRRGRREEFNAFRWEGEVPDPQEEATFERSRLDHELKQKEPHRTLRELYGELLRWRRERPALAYLSKEHQEVIPYAEAKGLFVRRWTADDEVFMVYNFGTSETVLTVPAPAGSWHRGLDSAAARWRGPGGLAPEWLHSLGEITLSLPPRSFALFGR